MNSKTLSPWKTTRQQLSQFASLKEHIFWNQLHPSTEQGNLHQQGHSPDHLSSRNTTRDVQII